LRIVQQLNAFPQHDRQTLNDMLDALRILREQGRDLIED